VADPARTDFDEYEDSYREEVEESISFAGGNLDHFTAAKADVLVDLAGTVVGPPESLSFLDLGCGPGETDAFLEGRVAALTGVDVAAKAVESARARNPWAEYRHVEAGAELPFASGSFDVCFAICVFHHVPVGERPALVAEMSRVCKPGGLVALFEHNPYNPLTRRAVSRCVFDEDAELLRRGETAALLREAGLDTVSGRYIVFFTRSSPLRGWIERRLGWLPLGAQYAVAGRRP
jgi:SAM-dependent methyltransferase